MTKNLIKKTETRRSKPVKAAMNVPRVLTSVWVVRDDNEQLHAFTSRDSARAAGLGVARRYFIEE